MIKFISFSALWMISLLLYSYAQPATMNKNGQSVIKLPLNNWGSQRVMTYALGTMIESLGQSVEYKNINSHDQWGALPKGLVHIQLEVWQVSMAEDFNRMLQQGDILDMGTHEAIGKEDWWYPNYVEELCPGLPDWQAMNSCAEIFSTPTSKGKGVYYAGPWDYGDGDIIRALELNFIIHRFKNDTEVWQELARALKNKDPIILLNWTPNWTDIRAQGKFIQFPTYQVECESDPSWGINKHLTKDCANPSNGWLKKAVWPGLKQQHPCVFQLVKNINLSTKMIADAAALKVIDKHDEELAAKIWLKKYHKEVNKWLDFECKKT